jgi:putative MATE family efflux protein
MQRRPTEVERGILSGSLGRCIWRLGWPVLLSQALMMFPGLYDAVWLGQLGPEAQAAAGLAMSARYTMISVLMALSSGSGAVVARYVGARDQEGANLAAMQAILLMVAASGSLGAAGVLLARPLMVLVGADPEVLPLAVRYARVLFAGLIAMELVPSMGFMLNAAGAPEVLLAMTLWSGGTLLVAEPLLTRWLGIDGAALALVGANAVGMLWGLGVVFSGRGPIRVDLRQLRIDLPMMGRILRVAGPAVIQRGTPNVANTLLTRIVSGYGAATLAAWIVVRRIFQFATIPSLGLARVTPALVGQNLGAGNPDRAQDAVRVVLRTALATGVGVLGLLAILAVPVLSVFSDDAATIASGARVVRILSVGYLAFSLSTVYDTAQAGAGDTMSPMVINVVSLWAVQVPLAYLLSRAPGVGAEGIWIALVLGYGLQLALMWFRFRQGRWREKVI